MLQRLNLNLIGQILNQHPFNDQEPMTLKEIAEHEGVSHQCIAEVLARALLKIRKKLEEKNIKLEDLL